MGMVKCRLESFIKGDSDGQEVHLRGSPAQGVKVFEENEARFK